MRLVLSVPIRLALSALALAWAAPVAVAGDGGAGRANPIRFLTGPQPGEARDLALAYLDRHRGDLGLTAADLADAAVAYEYRTRHNGVTHIYLRQRLAGLEVANGDLNINVDREGRIINLGNRFVRDLAGTVNTRVPAIGPEHAVAAGAAHLGLGPAGSLPVVSAPGGPAQEVTFAGGGLSRDDIPVKLVYWRTRDGAARLAWDLVLRPFDDRHWWNLWVDAVTGDVLAKSDWVDWDSYNVYALPKDSPDDGDRTLEVDPADPVASPFGWHDTDGAPGAEFNDTRGNNTFAQEDLDANNSGGFRPDGGPSREFDFPIDLDTQLPGDYLEAAITNLFYWNNILHDTHYQYGFDEPAGNFQENNYGNGGLGSDPVQADAQDGSGTNNANFATFPDGIAARMQMFIWLDPATERVTVNSPPEIAGDYFAGPAAFGPDLDEIGITADLALVDDGSGDPTLGCNPLVGFPAGRLALIDRGTCTFVTKVRHAQNAGAMGAVVVNNAGDGLLTMGDDGTGGDIEIPSVFLGQSDGETIKAQLDGGVNSTIKHSSAPPRLDRDSDLDNGVIAHEYEHGVSNRLTGGPQNVNCLFVDEQAGEGWSDFSALFHTAMAGDTGEMPRGIATYVSFQPSDGTGIRRYPYSTDMNVNPETYADLPGAAIPHGVGAIWAGMLWEVYWNFVDRYGFDPDLYNGTGGNNILYQLVIDGMKLQPCNPHFVDARDAILEADLVNNGGANQCEIWKGFAKRGLGVSADAGSNDDTTDGTPAFDVPPECAAISCADVRRFQARCTNNDTIQARVTFFDTSHSGQTITLEVDGVANVLTVQGGQARLQIPGAADGNHTVELTDPTCEEFEPITVRCPQ